MKASKTIENHWWSRPGWYPGRLMDTWHILFDGAPAVHELARKCREALDDLPHLNLIPDNWLHMTVQGVGWADELSEPEVSAVVTQVAAELEAASRFVIELGPPIVKGEALVLEVKADEQLQDLRERLRRAVAVGLRGVPPTGPDQADGFTPHVSVAYARVTASAEPYARALQSVAPDRVTAEIGAVSLIRQDRILAPRWQYEWEELTRVPLARATTS